MKRGKDEEKIMGPMFPRLRLNDTEKGGPRAPPRNKMALYEQLSIPSQRLKPGVVPFNPNNCTNMIPPASTQGSSQQRGVLFSVQLPASRQAAEQAGNHFSDLRVPRVQLQSEKKFEEDDFRVPVIMQTNVCENLSRYRSENGQKLIHSSQAYTQHSTVCVPSGCDEMRRRSIVVPIKTQEGQSLNNGENVEELVGNSQKSVEAVSNSSSRKVAEVSECQCDAYTRGEPGDNSLSTNSALLKADPSLISQQKTERHSGSRVLRDIVLNGPASGMDIKNTSVLKRDYGSEVRRGVDDIESCEDGTCGSLPGSADVGDHTSETSMVDCVPGLVISPDDVVGIMGHKHFWKARKAIVNQQRVFAVQLFELHRLVKVQKLMAGSPDLLHDNSFLEKPLKTISTKRLPLEYIVKRRVDVVKPENGSENLNHRMEGSAENNVGKESLSSVHNGGQGQLLSSKPVSTNAAATAMPGDHALSSWCFHQPQGHHWLIPMMSPLEGLVYKPYYPGPGFVAPVCGPPGAPPVVGNFAYPAYGTTTGGMGVPPFASLAGPHGYFIPYSMPVMNHSIMSSTAHQTNHSTTSGLPVLSPGSGVDVSSQYPQTCMPSSQKDEVNGSIPNIRKLHESVDREVQASTGSSPSERGQGTGSGGSNVLPLFPTTPATDISSCNTQPQHTDRPAKVIKVVPRDGVSATKSAARIFQSIQQERKQHDV